MRDAGITVSTSGLDRAAWAVGQAASCAAQLAQATGQGAALCSDTGGPALDAALDEFLQAWSRGLRAVGDDLSLLRRFLTAAAGDYRAVDAGAVPTGRS